MDLFNAASVRAALRADFADYVAVERTSVREQRCRRDGLADALRLVFGRHHHEPRVAEQWTASIRSL